MKITRKQRAAIKAWLEWHTWRKTCVTNEEVDTVALVLLKLLEGEEDKDEVENPR